jgi:hypothetical protein
MGMVGKRKTTWLGTRTVVRLILLCWIYAYRSIACNVYNNKGVVPVTNCRRYRRPICALSDVGELECEGVPLPPYTASSAKDTFPFFYSFWFPRYCILTILLAVVCFSPSFCVVYAFIFRSWWLLSEYSRPPLLATSEELKLWDRNRTAVW